MSTRKKIRTIRILAFVIPFIAVLIGMLAGSFAPFGGKDVMTSGGMTEQLTHYYELYDHVHGGAVSTGNGYDFSSVFTYYLSDPLNLLILIFPRTAILGVINLLYAVKLGLAGLFMSIFLTHRKKRLIARKEAMEALRTDAIAELAEKKRLKKEKALAKAAAKGGKAKTDFKLGGSEEPKSGIGRLLASLDLPNLGFSTAFALSAYMVGQGLNVSHLTVIVLFPLLLMALDNLLENGKWRTYAALMTASVFCSLHMAIIVFIFSVIYTAAYDHSDLPGAVRNILLKLVSDLLAAGAGAVIIFSAASGPYFGSEISTSFPYGHVSTTFFDAFKALFPKTGPSSTLLYGYNIDIFCGMLAVFLVVLYVVNPNISLRRKLGQCGILAALTTALFLVTPNYLFNGLFYSRLNLCIFGFLFVFQLLSMAYEELINLDHSPAWSLHLCAAGLVALVVISLFRCDNYDQLQPFLVAVEFLFVYYILIVMYRSNSMTRWLLLTLLGLCTTGELVYCYVDNLRAAGSASSKYEATLDSRVYEVSRQIQEKEPDAKIVFYDPESSMSTPLSNTLSGVDYVLTDESLKRADSMLELTDTVNGVNIFKNPYSLKGFFLPEKVTEWYYDSTYPFTSLSQFATEVVGSKKLFTNAQGQFSNMYQIVYDDNWMEDMRNVDYIYTFVPSETGDLYGMVFNIRHFGTIEAGLPVNVVRRINDREYLGRTSFTYSYFNEEGLLDLYDRLSNTSLTIEDESHMTIRIDAPEDGYYVLPVPRNSGWTADQGTLTDLSFSQDLMMVSVKKGENTIHLSYRPTFLYIGLAISVLVLALLILLAMKDRIRISTGNRAITSVSEVIRENYVYLLTFGITTMVFIIMLWYTSSMPFGKNSVLIGDGYIQAYNGYRGIIHDVKDGSFSILNWNMGISIDRYMDYAGYALSPWSYLKLLIIPDSLIAFDQAFSYFLSFMLSGLCMVLYLTHRRRGSVMKKNDWRLIVIGVAYALSSYTIATFVYNGFGFLTTLPLIMLGMERLVYDKKPTMYIFLMFSFMGNAYYAFMLCEFLALYFFTMEFDSIKDFFMKGIRFALCSIAAAGLACYRLLPYYFHSVQSPYKTADVISPTTIESGNFLSVFSDTMSFRQPTVVSDDYFKANIYVGILVLFFVPLYLLNKKIPLSVRIRRSVLALLLFLGFGNSTLNYIFHGFHYQSNVPNRFAVFFIFLLLVMFYDCLISWKNYKPKTFAITIGGAFAVCVGLWSIAYFTDQIDVIPVTQDDQYNSYVMTLIFAGIYLVLALIHLAGKYRKPARKAMVGVLLAEMILSAFYSFKIAVGVEVYFSNDNTYITQLAKRNDDMTEDFHATEYIRNPEYNTAEYADMTSVTAFSSMMTSAHMELLHQWGIITSNNNVFYETGNPLADMMLHVQYHLTNDNNAKSISPYAVADHEGPMELHENPYYLPAGIFFSGSSEIQNWAKTNYSQYGDNSFAFQNAFSRAMGCGDIYLEIEPEKDPEKITEETKDDLSYIEADPTAFLEGQKSEVPAVIHVGKDVEGDVYATYFSAVTYLGTTKKGEADTFEMTMYLPADGQDYYIRIGVTDKNELEKLHAKLSENVMSDAGHDFASVTGSIDAPEDGMLYLSIPKMQEWNYYVDGQKVEATQYLGGIGLSLTAGHHDIEVKYVPEGMWLGIGVSVGTLLLLILIAIFFHTRRKKTAAEVVA